MATQTHRLSIHMDNLRAGHAFIELFQPGDENGEVYGFYPEKFDEKREVLVGKGMIRKDRSRLDDGEQEADIEQLTKQVNLNEEQFFRAINYLDEKANSPHHYFLVGYNCIDFIQDLYAETLGEEAGSFLELYGKEELDSMSWTGFYAKLLRKIAT